MLNVFKDTHSTTPCFPKTPQPVDKRWLSQSSNAAGYVFNLALTYEMIRGVGGGEEEESTGVIARQQTQNT